MAWTLFVLSTLLQAAAYAGLWPNAPHSNGKLALSIAEMALMAAVLARSVMLWRAANSALARRVAMLCMVGMGLCVLGDAINRNFSQTFFRYDDVIEHSYLADSVWGFLPGYGLWMIAAGVLTQKLIGTKAVVLSLLATATVGMLSFLSMRLPGTSTYVTVMTGAYAMVITSMVAAAWWLWRGFGAKARWVALGAVLAPVADSLIGQFWLYGKGWYPAIAYLNWVVYFGSQLLVQQLPRLARDAAPPSA